MWVARARLLYILSSRKWLPFMAKNYCKRKCSNAFQILAGSDCLLWQTEVLKCIPHCNRKWWLI